MDDEEKLGKQSGNLNDGDAVEVHRKASDAAAVEAEVSQERNESGEVEH